MKKSSSKKSVSKQKVGSNPEAAKNFGSKKDFGASESDPIEREYASRAARSQDPGGEPGRAGNDGERIEGVGGNASGPGASSGGDLDPDTVGVGFEGDGVATSGKIHEPVGPDDAVDMKLEEPGSLR